MIAIGVPSSIAASINQGVLNSATIAMQDFYRHQYDQNVGDVKGMITKGVLPNDDSLAALADMAAKSGDPKKMEDLRTTYEEVRARQEARGLDATALSSAITMLRSAETDGGLSVRQEAALEIMQGEQKARAALAEKGDAIGLAIRTHALPGPPPPIDWTGKTAPMDRQIAARVPIANAAAHEARLPAASILQPSEADGLRDTLARGTPEQSAAVYSGLLRLDRETLLATLSQPDVNAVIQGATRTDDPAKYGGAMDFLSGVRKRAPADFARVFDDRLLTQTLAYETSSVYKSPAAILEDRNRAYSPSEAKAREQLGAEADKTILA
ncbi:MAG: hypothetical protein ACREDP_25675, partial [Bradyrhizobium sp.]